MNPQNLFSLCLLSILCICGVYALDAPAGTPATKHLSYQKDGGLEYWLYQENTEAEKPPILIFLHGKGETTMTSLLKWGPPKHAEAGQVFPGIVVAPLSPNGEWWNRERIIVFIDSVAKKYNVDLHRIYITGLSMGGFATWDVATHYPGRFAAMVPICGGGNPDLVGAIKNIPCRVFHGAIDNVVKQKASDAMVDALKALGSSVEYTIYPNEGHACWIPTYANKELYTWIYAQRREIAADIDPHAALKHELKTGIEVDVSPRLLETKIHSETTITISWKNTTAYTATVKSHMNSGDILHAELSAEPLTLAAGASVEQICKLTGFDKKQIDYGLINLSWSIHYQKEGLEEQRFNQDYHFRLTPRYELKQQKISIDGDTGDWSKHWLSGDTQQAKGVATDTQCSYVFQAAYDQEYLYVMVQVKDDRTLFNAKKSVWDQDGVEIRLDARLQETCDSYTDWNDFLPLLISPQPEGGLTVWNQNKLPAGTKMDTKIIQGGYTVEVGIPLSYVSERAGKDWKRVRLNIAVNDYDSEDKRGPQLWWYPDWRSSFDSRLEGTFERVP